HYPVPERLVEQSIRLGQSRRSSRGLRQRTESLSAPAAPQVLGVRLESSGPRRRFSAVSRRTFARCRPVWTYWTKDWRVLVAADAVSSCAPENYRLGLQRMGGAGAIIVSRRNGAVRAPRARGKQGFKQVLTLVK